MIGAVLAGLITWTVWPAVDGEIHSWALLVSLLGAVAVVVSWAGWSYARSVSGHA